MSKQRYGKEVREKVLRLYLEEGRTKKSLTAEYHLGSGTISYWLQQHRKECQSNPKTQETNDAYEETKRLRKELEEMKKENAFLKKAAAFFAKDVE